MDTNARVRDVGREAQSIQEDLNHDQVFRWLSAMDTSSNHHQASKKRAADTGKWFIDSSDYVEWKLHPQSVYWLHGLLGCGKTVLASTIIDDLSKHCQTTQNALAYFYFFKSPDRQDCTKMLRALIRQLAAKDPDCLKILTESYLIHEKGLRQPSVRVLSTLLHSTIETCGTTFIVLDALDECHSREELLELIDSIQLWDHTDLHILLTSRSEPDIRRTVELWNNKHITNIQNSSNSEDIRTHILSRLSHDSRLSRWRKDADALKEIEVRIMGKADGMYDSQIPQSTVSLLTWRYRFLMANCQLDALQTCLTMDKLITVLKSLPSTLNDTYAQILVNIEMAYRDLAIKAFRWLIHSERSISLDEMVDILAIDVAVQPRFNPNRRLMKKEEVSQICSNLIEVSCLGESKSVRLAHLSVREYLTSNQILAAPTAAFAQRPHEAHASIAQDCLIYLLQLKNSQDVVVRELYDRRVDLERTYHTLPMKQWTRSADKFEKDLRASLPLMSYAERYWMHHARLAGEKPEQLFQLMVEAFEPHIFEAWFHFFDKPWCKRMSSHRLAYAIECRLPRLVRHLLDQDIDVNLSGAERRTPLQAAAMIGDLELVELLLKHGAGVNLSHTGRESALWYAANGGFIEIVELLLDQGADIENHQTVEQFRAFLVAAAERLPFTMARIWTGNDSVENESAAQVEVSLYVNLEVVLEVLTANGFMKGLAADQKAGLKAAAVQRDEEKLELLIAANFDVDAFMIKVEEDFRRWRCPNMPTPLQAAAKEGHVSSLQLLIDRGADVNHQEYSLQSAPALYQASAAGHLEAVQLLLRSGADPNSRPDWHKPTALQVALEKGHGLIAQLLLTSGAAKDVGDGLQARLEDVQKGITTFQKMSFYDLAALFSRHHEYLWRLACQQPALVYRQPPLSALKYFTKSFLYTNS